MMPQTMTGGDINFLVTIAMFDLHEHPRSSGSSIGDQELYRVETERGRVYYAGA